MKGGEGSDDFSPVQLIYQLNFLVLWYLLQDTILPYYPGVSSSLSITTRNKDTVRATHCFQVR